MSDTEGGGGDKLIRVRRGKVDSLSVYEVTSFELDILEQGHPNSLHLNFSIFLIGIAIAFCIALFTTKIASQTTLIVFIVVAVCSAIIGLFLLALWFKNRKSTPDVIKSIKSRLSEAETTESHS
jgi:NADH:ubiquinone oxidoreductase subunit K